ncbi:hypothetical protein VE25_09695 [Devosia geojensis]|uniref:Uncharacterized protein n=1 Tax=Devosia geojensis TaxID=443610 RepID=A0A0F5FT61_9HYPH|nr:hypothetical protein [Devosia geojensis]KKB12039.1 hypothetical protein VE25_09695 [Devosia geojensis]
MASAPATSAPRRAPAIAYNLAGLAVIAALAAVGAAYLLDFHMSSRQAAPSAKALTSIVTRTIGARELRIPYGWFRSGADLTDEFATQIDLAATVTLDGFDKPATIDVTLLPRSRVRPSEVLLDTVYVHEFEAETLRGPPGLVGKPLRPARGYGGETVWYDPLSPAPFVAKCMAPIQPESPARCLRTVILPSGIGAVYAFDETVLASWKEFDAVTQRMMTAIGA